MQIDGCVNAGSVCIDVLRNLIGIYREHYNILNIVHSNMFHCLLFNS